MILDLIINMVDILLDIILLPSELLTLGFTAINFAPLQEAMKVANYIMPISALSPLLVIIFAIGTGRVTIALINFVKGYIPFMG